MLYKIVHKIDSRLTTDDLKTILNKKLFHIIEFSELSDSSQ